MTEQALVRLNGNRLTTTSLAISRDFGKKHMHVLRDIRSLRCSKQFIESNFGLNEYKDGAGRTLPMYDITRDGFAFLCMGFTGAAADRWKERYIETFNKMEAVLRAQAGPSASDIRMLQRERDAYKWGFEDLEKQVLALKREKFESHPRWMAIADMRKAGRSNGLIAQALGVKLRTIERAVTEIHEANLSAFLPEAPHLPANLYKSGAQLVAGTQQVEV
jgi:Rha family phage regulatory protein